ncbi:L-selectin-like [Oratosquilla oratoria]|uniref:L-selectin-like n=1 Tax=Oratosquilla oratoria TaxID=337810 RepID=UPI003F762CD1
MWCARAMQSKPSSTMLTSLWLILCCSSMTLLWFPGYTDAMCDSKDTHATFKDGRYAFFFTWFVYGKQGLSRQQSEMFCRQRCMDLVHFDDLDVANAVMDLVEKSGVQYIWTSGTLQSGRNPVWYWKPTGKIIGPEARTYWSNTGGLNEPQPDNQEGRIGGETEACLAVFNNVYNDGVKWHDVACHYKKPFVCMKTFS